MTNRLNFILEKKAANSGARATRFRTLHSEVITPVFMPVATQAAMRGQTTETMESLGAQVLLANTFHLLLRPGPEVFEKVGGIHRFMRWNRSVLTDSGGFQIFSLAKKLTMSEEGAHFRSYVDGKTILLSPEKSIAMQRSIGSDIMMVLDECIPSKSEFARVKESLELTTRWAKRSLAARGDSLQSLFGIVQGACFAELRKVSASRITELPFDGFAIGGLAVGEERQEREDMTELTAALLPEDKPRYLMGVGTPIDLLEAVHRGVDMFDCILPTSLGQQGVCFTSHGKIDLRRGVYKFADIPLDAACTCTTCTRYSRAYLSHLMRAGEYLGGQLAGVHNLFFYQKLMESMRAHILADTFDSFYRENREKLPLFDVDNPSTPPKRKAVFPPLSLGDYEVKESEKGYASIAQISSGETMHSVSDPIAESKLLYVEQAKLHELIKLECAEPLVIWDVGLGAGTNAMGTISFIESFLEKENRSRTVHLISFERDLDSLKLALLHPRLFPHIRHQAPHELLKAGVWRSKDLRIEWTLIQGDFATAFSQVKAPRIIYYDPFSYKVDSPLWSHSLFSELYRHCSKGACELFTYSASTMVRASLLGAGFYVARGVGTGPKQDTTIALTRQALNERSEARLLDTAWLSRWDKSDAKYPHDCSTNGEKEFERCIRTHPQFL